MEKRVAYPEIKKAVLNWVRYQEAYFVQNNVTLNILKDASDGFVASFENNNAMAELVVEQANNVPYRFVIFEVAAIQDNRAKIVYRFYDDDSHSKDDIENALQNGIDYLISLGLIN